MTSFILFFYLATRQFKHYALFSAAFENAVVRFLADSDALRSKAISIVLIVALPS